MSTQNQGKISSHYSNKHPGDSSSNDLSKYALKFASLISNFLAKQLFNSTSLGAYFEPIVQLVSPTWRQGQTSAKVTSVRQENDATYTISLKPSRRWNGFTAGQFIQLTAEIDGAYISRTFSISSSPTTFSKHGTIDLTIRTQDKGMMTSWLNQNLKPNDTVYISSASGDFVLQDQKPEKVFIAGGSGLTPIHSIISEMSTTADLNKLHLLFFIPDTNSLFFEKQLAELKQKGLNLRTIYTRSEGHISQKHLQDSNVDPTNCEFYICGPEGLIHDSLELLNHMQVESASVRFEYFKAPSRQFSQLNLRESGNSSALNDEVIEVNYLDSNKQGQYKPESFLGEENKSLLDIAEEEGLKPISGCRMGVCHQCICKKKSGRVFNKKTATYSDSGEEEIQLCLSVPVGKVELEL